MYQNKFVREESLFLASTQDLISPTPLPSPDDMPDHVQLIYREK